MAEKAIDADGAVARRDPAADGGMFLIIAGMAAGVVYEHPAGLWIGQGRPALKRMTIVIGKLLKRFHAFAGFVKRTVTENPVCDSRRRGCGDLVLEKLPRELEVVLARLALKRDLVEQFHPLVFGPGSLDFRTVHDRLCLFDDERAV